MNNPWMKSITIPAANTNVNLLTRMQVVDPDAPKLVDKLQIQYDPENTVGVFLRVGNSDVAASVMGAKLMVGQAVTFEPTGLNSLHLSQFTLRSDAAAQQLNIIALVR